MRPMAGSEDIDRLILELHATTAGSAVPGDLTRIERWLRLLASRTGSDLLLVAGAPPSIRVDGRVLPLAEGPLDGVDIEEAVIPALPPHARRIYRDDHIVDGSFRVQGLGRFRINLHRERGRAAAALRALPPRIPRLSTLGLPASVELLADSFPDERQNTIRQELSMALAVVMTQTLLPKVGGGLVPAAELLMVSYGARQHIRKNALQHMHQEMTITRKLGSFTLEESLARLVKHGL